MKNRQIDTKSTKQIRIDAGWHKLLRIEAAKGALTIKELVEGYFADCYSSTDDIKETKRK